MQYLHRIFRSEIPVKQNELICHRQIKNVFFEIEMINVDHVKTVNHQANILAETGLNCFNQQERN